MDFFRGPSKQELLDAIRLQQEQIECLRQILQEQAQKMRQYICDTVKRELAEQSENLDARIWQSEEDVGKRLAELNQSLDARIWESDEAMGKRFAELSESLDARIWQSEENVGKRLAELNKNLDARIWESDKAVGKRLADLSESLDARIWRSEEDVGRRLAELNKNLDARIWQSEEDVGKRLAELNKSLDARIWESEEAMGKRLAGLSESLDSRIWQSEEEIGKHLTELSQSIDARIWRSEEDVGKRLEGLNKSMDGRIWQSEDNILQTVDGRIWKAELKLLEELPYKFLKLVPKKKLDRLTIHLVEHCNLNCQCCDNFSPIAAESYTSLDALEKDFIQMGKIGGTDVGKIELSGGEALLHPQICDFIVLTTRYFKTAEVNIVTNGILLANMSDDFWRTCGQCNIVIVITKYPINLNMERIEEKAKEYGVRWRYYEDIELKTSFFAPFDLKGGQNANGNFVECFHANTCIYLRDGRIYTCSIAANVHHFNKYFYENLPDVPGNSISIYEVKSMGEILEFLSRPIPLCKYCDIAGRKFNLPWGVSKQRKGEWVSGIENGEEKFELLE